MNSFQTKTPTARQIDEAYRKGLFVFRGNREKVLGCVARRSNDIPIKSHVWVQMASDLAWYYLPAREIVVTNEVTKRKDNDMEVVGKKSGKRGPGHTGLPSESAARAKKSSKNKDNGKADGGRVTVTRSSVKQGELPGVQTSTRKIVEIEDLAEKLDDAKAVEKTAKEKREDCEQNLIASLKRHEKVFYSRQTWGSVKLKVGKDKATVKRDKTKGDEE